MKENVRDAGEREVKRGGEGREEDVQAASRQGEEEKKGERGDNKTRK